MSQRPYNRVHLENILGIDQANPTIQIVDWDSNVQPIECAQSTLPYNLRPRLVPPSGLNVVGGPGVPSAGSRQSEVPAGPEGPESQTPSLMDSVRTMLPWQAPTLLKFRLCRGTLKRSKLPNVRILPDPAFSHWSQIQFPHSAQRIASKQSVKLLRTQSRPEFQPKMPALYPVLAGATISADSSSSVTATDDGPSAGPVPEREDLNPPSLQQYTVKEQ